MRATSLVVAGAAVVATILPGIDPAHATPATRDQPPVSARLQHRLNLLGCDAGRADGKVDQHRRTAVIRFQSAAHLRQTGRLDTRTAKRLQADGAPRCDRRPVPRRSGAGRRIVVSQQQNWVWLVGPRGRVVAQGGMVDNTEVLRPGRHRVGSYCGRAARIKRNQDYGGGLWLDDFVRFAPCGVGFHRIPRHRSTGRQIHGDWLLGTDLERSHGCLRLSKELADQVWRFTRKSTVVRVI